MPTTQFASPNFSGPTQGPSGESNTPEFSDVVGILQGNAGPSSGGLMPVPMNIPGSIRIAKTKWMPSAQRALVSIVDRNSSAAISQIISFGSDGLATIPNTSTALAADPRLIPGTLRVDYINLPKSESLGPFSGMSIVTAIQNSLSGSKSVDAKKRINVSLFANNKTGDFGMMMSAAINITATFKIAFFTKQLSVPLSLEIRDSATKKARLVLTAPWWVPSSATKAAQDLLNGLSRTIQSESTVTHWSYTVAGRAPAGAAGVANGWVSTAAATTANARGTLHAEVDLMIDSAS